MSLNKVKKYINSKRRDFADQPLDEQQTSSNPFEQYAIWFEEALAAEILDPYAACISTVNKLGQPSSRMVYIRDVIDEGFVFYTNYKSSKATDIEANNLGSFNIFWGELERQIRINGTIEKVSAEISDAYFNARPRASQLGAWASSQSKELSSRDELTEELESITKQFEGKAVTRPPHWGGYRLIPSVMEFWQGRPSRLHDRIVYTKINDKWERSRLSP
jgi:pyridoxamine 5'-phosphate oxidase